MRLSFLSFFVREQEPSQLFWTTFIMTGIDAIESHLHPESVNSSHQVVFFFLLFRFHSIILEETLISTIVYSFEKKLSWN